MSDNAIDRFFGGSPAWVIVRLILLSIVIGVLLTAFGFDPWNLIPSIQRLIHKIWNLGWNAIDSVWRYFVLGAIIVFPIWLIARLVRSRRENLPR